MYVSLKPGFDAEQGDRAEGERSDRQGDRQDRATEARLDRADMPKTRSGKIMRRVIAAISNFADVGDTTTLANPEIVEDL